MYTYKLQLWKDIIPMPASGAVEQLLYEIGNSSYNNEFSAYNIEFTSNINGEETLSFDIDSYCLNNIGESTINPYIEDIINEARVKLYFNNQWYDFIIRNIAINHTTKMTYHCECQQLSIYELSKIGYDITFSLDDESGSAIQDAHSFMTQTLASTDWTYIQAGQAGTPAEDFSVDLSEYSTEIASQYQILEAASWSGATIYNAITEQSTGVIVTRGYIYIPASENDSLLVSSDAFIKAIYSSEEVTEIDGNTFEKEDLVAFKVSEIYGHLGALVWTKFSIEIPQKTVQTKYIYYLDSASGDTINSYCDVLTYDTDKTAYRKLVTYSNISGYQAVQETSPAYRATVSTENSAVLSSAWFVVNNIYINFDFGVPTFSNGDIVDIYKSGTEWKCLINRTTNSISGTEQEDDPPEDFYSTSSKIYYRKTESSSGLVSYSPYYNLATFEYTYIKDGQVLTSTEWYDFILDATSDDTYNVQTFSRYRYFELTSTGAVSYIGYGLITDDYCYKKEKTLNGYYFDTEDLCYKQVSTGNYGDYKRIEMTPSLTSNMQRTMEVSKSNCFNIVQTIAETFEVQSKFIVTHDSTGAIENKYVTLISYGQEEIPFGFTYGLNASEIQRTIESKDIITKLYVDSIESDLTDNGYVSVDESDQNPTGENFLIDFSYYINNGMLDSEDTIKDLYNNPSTSWKASAISDVNFVGRISRAAVDTNSVGVFPLLKYLNEQYNNINSLTDDGQISISNRLSSLEASYNTLSIQINNSQATEEEKASLIAQRQHCENEITSLTEKYSANSTKLSTILTKKALVLKKFQEKYSRFVQEGSWSGSDYVSNDAYYFDALKVLKNSSLPSAEYSLKFAYLPWDTKFQQALFYKPGQATWIEDTELFGKDSTGKPIHKNVIIKEITYNLQSPAESTITIGSLSNDFKDIFSKLMASSQSYSLNENSYQVTSKLIDGGTGITPTTFQKSLSKNKKASVVENDNVIVDNSGVEVISSENPQSKIKIVSNGIFLSDDGGETYTTGIYAGEINTSLIKSGTISTKNLSIKDEDTAANTLLELAGSSIVARGPEGAFELSPGGLFLRDGDNNALLAFENGKLTIGGTDSSNIGPQDSITTSNNYTFDSDGLTIATSNIEEPKTTVTNNGLKISRTDGDTTTVLLEVNKDGVNGDNLTADIYLTIGGRSRFENYTNNGNLRTGCFFIV